MNDPTPLAAAVAEYVEWLRVGNHAGFDRKVDQFCTWVVSIGSFLPCWPCWWPCIGIISVECAPVEYRHAYKH